MMVTMSTDINPPRQNVTKTLRLPSRAQQVLDGYLHVKVEDTNVPCPYHINPGMRSTKRALLGKGRPQEIEQAAAHYFRKYAMYADGDDVTLRSFLLACGLGVDCSGFAAWVLNGVTEAVLGRPIWKCLRFPGWRRSTVSKLRPIENISANLLTGQLNSEIVHDLSEVRPGDLIRMAAGHHVAVIIEVGLDKAGKAVNFQYAQSSCMYGWESGVRTGRTVIQKSQGSLLDQQWFDNYERNIIKGLIAEGDDSRVVRLRALARQAE